MRRRDERFLRQELNRRQVQICKTRAALHDGNNAKVRNTLASSELEDLELNATLGLGNALVSLGSNAPFLHREREMREAVI